MSREILFRAKTKATKEWTYGHFAKQYDVPQIYAGNGHECIYEDTLCQYIGLTDKNGTKIFEGDIVSKEFYTNHKRTKSKSFKGVVEYKVRCGKGFGIDGEDFKSWAAEWSVNFNFGSDEQKYRAYSWGLFFDCEVIGNIYDNPELIEE